MALQRSHDKLYPLVSPVDELPEGQADQAAPVERRPDGRVASADAARELGRRGGAARARRQAAIASAGARLKLGRHLTELRASEHLSKFVDSAEAWLDATARELAASVGGGRLSPMVVSALHSAAWAKCFADFFYDAASRETWTWDRSEGSPPVRPNTDLPLAAARMATESRQHCIAAFELAAREAQSRPRPRSVAAGILAELEQGTPGVTKLGRF